jgi:hypothetical protein
MLQLSLCLLPLLNEKVSDSLTGRTRKPPSSSEIVFFTDRQAENVPK